MEWWKTPKERCRRLFGAVRQGFLAAKHWFRYHAGRVSSGGIYDDFNHEHICLIARLLEEEDFRAICPNVSKPYDGYPIEFRESSDQCDLCKYSCTIDFSLDKNGEKQIVLSGDEDFLDGHPIDYERIKKLYEEWDAKGI